MATDSAYLNVLARTELGYIGILGPRKRRAKILASLGAAGERLEARLRGPVGIDIGAVTPEGIALSIAAELHSFAAH